MIHALRKIKSSHIPPLFLIFMSGLVIGGLVLGCRTFYADILISALEKLLLLLRDRLLKVSSAEGEYLANPTSLLLAWPIGAMLKTRLYEKLKKGGSRRGWSGAVRFGLMILNRRENSRDKSG